MFYLIMCNVWSVIVFNLFLIMPHFSHFIVLKESLALAVTSWKPSICQYHFTWEHSFNIIKSSTYFWIFNVSVYQTDREVYFPGIIYYLSLEGNHQFSDSDWPSPGSLNGPLFLLTVIIGLAGHFLFGTTLSLLRYRWQHIRRLWWKVQPSWL